MPHFLFVTSVLYVNIILHGTMQKEKIIKGWLSPVLNCLPL